MKTSEEIKKGLECAMPRNCNGHKCSTCPNATYSLHELLKGDLIKDTFDYITQLEQRLAQAEEALAFERAYREDQAVAGELKCSLLEREAAQAKRERDAAVEDLSLALDGVDQMNNDCCFCKHNDKPVCETCDWEWRGVCDENSKEENNG